MGNQEFQLHDAIDSHEKIHQKTRFMGQHPLLVA
jgi:hypothetical protein